MAGNISGLAVDIFKHEFDATFIGNGATSNGVSLTSISGWLNENFGLLNTYIYTNMSGNGINEVAGFNLEEQDIYKELYLYHYYTKQARNVLRGISTDVSGSLTSVRDGEQSINFVNKNEVAKTYKSFARDSYDKMLRLIQGYNSYQAAPRQVGGIESILQPTGAGS